MRGENQLKKHQDSHHEDDFINFRSAKIGGSRIRIPVTSRPNRHDQAQRVSNELRDFLRQSERTLQEIEPELDENQIYRILEIFRDAVFDTEADTWTYYNTPHLSLGQISRDLNSIEPRLQQYQLQDCVVMVEDYLRQRLREQHGIESSETRYRPITPSERFDTALNRVASPQRVILTLTDAEVLAIRTLVMATFSQRHPDMPVQQVAYYADHLAEAMVPHLTDPGLLRRGRGERQVRVNGTHVNGVNDVNGVNGAHGTSHHVDGFVGPRIVELFDAPRSPHLNGSRTPPDYFPSYYYSSSHWSNDASAYVNGEVESSFEEPD